ncbi:MAG: response regulator [Deltaproteobacteria bacterium]|nr:response regulator [Deltaproteobacteria bacterium]
MKQETTMDRPKVLCVDDEKSLLEGLVLHLHRSYEAVTATSGEEGLELLKTHGPFAVVMSDMRMPGMDGAAFLSRVRQAAPNTVRLLLTGYADLNSAVAAVNEGQIFRFLTKPCPPDQLLSVFQAAAEQYRLITAERVLLEETLRGSIRILVDVLSLASPLAFGRANRVRRHANELAEALKAPNRWQIEVSAMLSQLGSIAVPEYIIRKHDDGEDLTDDERAMMRRIPAVAEGLVANIPRLEPIRDILSQYVKLSTAGAADAAKPGLGAAILSVAIDYDVLESRGFSTARALAALCARPRQYDPTVLETFMRLKSRSADRPKKAVSLWDLPVGAVFAEDVRTRQGLLVVSRGFQVTASFLERVRNYDLQEPLYVHDAPDEG